MKLLFWSLRKTQIQDHEGFLSGATVAVMSIKEMDGLEWEQVCGTRSLSLCFELVKTEMCIDTLWECQC